MAPLGDTKFLRLVLKNISRVRTRGEISNI